MFFVINTGITKILVTILFLLKKIMWIISSLIKKFCIWKIKNIWKIKTTRFLMVGLLDLCRGLFYNFSLTSKRKLIANFRLKYQIDNWNCHFFFNLVCEFVRFSNRSLRYIKLFKLVLVIIKNKFLHQFFLKPMQKVTFYIDWTD